MIGAWRRQAWPADVVLASYCLLLAGISVGAQDRLPQWWVFALGHLAVLLGSALVVRAEAAWPENRIARFVHAWDALVWIPVVFFMACAMVHHVHPMDRDPELIRIDRALGGVDVLRAMERITAPGLTLAAKILWIAYYFLPLLIGIPLWRRPDRAAFRNMKGMLVLGFTLSYVGYFLVPAQGPGYFAEEMGIRLPRWEESPATVRLREIIHALEHEARDTFPSGHALIAGLVAILLVRAGERRWAIAGVPLCLGVILSTLYLRYHYLVDVLAGLALAAGIAAFWPAGRAGLTGREPPIK